MITKIKYLFRCILRMDYKELFKTVGTVHKICGKNRIFLFFDIIMCGIKYGAGYKDYLLCEYFNLTKAQRQTYVTRGLNNSISKLMNAKDGYYIYHNKDIMYDKYKDYIKREWHFMPKTSLEEFETYMKDREQIIIKPSNETCGNGVEKLKKSDFKSVADMYKYITDMPLRIAEDVIAQHPDLDALYPRSINTIRVVTIYANGKGNIIYAYIRIGNSDRPVDNLNAGGMCAPIDLETGKIAHNGYDKNRIEYEAHPLTNCKIKGFQIPKWKEIVKLTEECATVVPEMGYLGWDVAITPDDIVIVETNDFPGHDFLQMPPHVPDKIGMLPQFKKYVKGL